MREAVGRSRASGGAERGAQMFRSPTTGTRIVTGREAGRGTSGEFSFKPGKPGERRVMTSHTHNGSAERGVRGARETASNNAPSEQDQQALHKSRAAVQIVAPAVSGTLYRVQRQDYFVVETGNPRAVPGLDSQKIIVISPTLEDE